MMTRHLIVSFVLPARASRAYSASSASCGYFVEDAMFDVLLRQLGPNEFLCI